MTAIRTTRFLFLPSTSNLGVIEYGRMVMPAIETSNAVSIPSTGIVESFAQALRAPSVWISSKAFAPSVLAARKISFDDRLARDIGESIIEARRAEPSEDIEALAQGGLSASQFLRMMKQQRAHGAL